MLAEMMLRSDEEGRGVIQLTVPSANTIKVAEAIRGVLSLAGHKVRRVNSEGEEIVSADEVFPDGCGSPRRQPKRQLRNGKREAPDFHKNGQAPGGRIQSSVQGISVICMGHREHSPLTRQYHKSSPD